MDSIASQSPLPIMFSKARISELHAPNEDSCCQKAQPHLSFTSIAPLTHDDQNPVLGSEAPFHCGTTEEALNFPPTWQTIVWLKTSDDKVFRVNADLVRDSSLIADVTGGHMCVGGSNMAMAIPLYTIDSRVLTILLESLNGLNALHSLESASHSVSRSLNRIETRKGRWEPYAPPCGSRARPATRASTRIIAKASKRLRTPTVRNDDKDEKDLDPSTDEMTKQWQHYMGQFDLDTLFHVLSAADFLDIEPLVFECNRVIDAKLRNSENTASGLSVVE